MCVDMCIDMCVDMCIVAVLHSLGHTDSQARVTRHVCRLVRRHPLGMLRTGWRSLGVGRPLYRRVYTRAVHMPLGDADVGSANKSVRQAHTLISQSWILTQKRDFDKAASCLEQALER